MSIKSRILEKICEYDKIVIHRHISPDPDAMGSQMGMYHFIKENFPLKDVNVTGVFSEKLAYFNAHSRLKDKSFENALIIITDTANSERIDDKRWTKGAFVIKIDHHPIDDNYGDINWVDSTKSSTSEMIYDFYKEYSSRYSMSNDAKKLILAGVVADTNRFLFPSTTSNTFQLALELKKDNVDFKEIYDVMYSRNFSDLKYFGYILSNLVIDDRVGYIILDDETIKNNKVDVATSSNLIGELNNIVDFDVWVFITQDKQNDNFRVNIRSRGPIINDVASKFGGGGHIYASGVKIKQLDKALDLIKALKQRVKEFNNE
ncbi:MAG: DHH family phosphoesterase [Bacilli bacterium]